MTIDEKMKILYSLQTELTEVYTRLHKDPYPSLSGVFFSLFTSEVLVKDDPAFNNVIDVINILIKDLNLQYYKKVSSGVFAA